jgi:hypothetical protein
MPVNLSDIKDVAVIAKPLIDEIVKTLVTPYIGKLKDWVQEKKIQSIIVNENITTKFEEYLLRTYQKFSIINILVFPNQQINIKDIYIPLSITSVDQTCNYKIFKEGLSFLKYQRKILVSDSAGMGKSTLLKWIGLSIIEKGTTIPILIELKRLTSNNKIIDEILSQLNPIEKLFDKDLIFKFLSFGQFTILLDGFDEIQSNHRKEVIYDLKDFIDKTNKNVFILTSRQEDSLSSFGDFLLFTIKPLELKESFNLIEKYESVGRFDIKERLIKDINDKLSQVREFLGNPFLVSLLYKTYTYNKNIPTKKSTFYDEVYGALYKQHDLSKDHFEREKKSGLDIYDFRLVLRQLAFDTAKITKVEYTNLEVIEFIRKAKESVCVQFKVGNFLTDIENSVPLFIKDGLLIKWAHKSLQDYFAAEWISNAAKKEELIKKIYTARKSNYLNILDFIYELEPKIFRKIILFDMIDRFIKYCENSYLKFKNVDIKSIRLRQGYTFSNSLVFTDKKLAGDDWKDAMAVYCRLLPNFNLSLISYGLSSFEFEKFKLVYECYGKSYDQEILELVQNKNEDIFSDRVQIPDGINENSKVKLSNSLPCILNDDSPINQLNSEENFSIINFLLIKITPRKNNFKVLDYEKCLRYRDKLEKEIIADNQTDIFQGI